jgi:hypothetical protein
VAVRAKDLKVLEAIVVAIAVDVMQRERERPFSPSREPALLTGARLETCVE